MQQKQKAESEVQEILQIEQRDLPEIGQVPPPEYKSRFFAAEDLALRAIQAEFQQPIKRQVTAGPDMDFDGVFTADHQLHIVEVKYVVREKNVEASIQRTLESFARFLDRTRWHNVKVIVAIVIVVPSRSRCSKASPGGNRRSLFDTHCVSLLFNVRAAGTVWHSKFERLTLFSGFRTTRTGWPSRIRKPVSTPHYRHVSGYPCRRMPNVTWSLRWFGRYFPLTEVFTRLSLRRWAG